ncbi:hypothetical protein RIF29_41278 [Crotalaria pallida]|uniref:Uncharacterized protein n=1 Tax=Crotalaria pallida TaxID=3830 RepID=A0AAN9E597_CROPI
MTHTASTKNTKKIEERCSEGSPLRFSPPPFDVPSLFKIETERGTRCCHHHRGALNRLELLHESRCFAVTRIRIAREFVSLVLWSRAPDPAGVAKPPPLHSPCRFRCHRYEGDESYSSHPARLNNKRKVNLSIYLVTYKCQNPSTLDFTVHFHVAWLGCSFADFLFPLLFQLVDFFSFPEHYLCAF